MTREGHRHRWVAVDWRLVPRRPERRLGFQIDAVVHTKANAMGDTATVTTVIAGLSLNNAITGALVATIAKLIVGATACAGARLAFLWMPDVVGCKNTSCKTILVVKRYYL